MYHTRRRAGGGEPRRAAAAGRRWLAAGQAVRGLRHGDAAAVQRRGHPGLGGLLRAVRDLHAPGGGVTKVHA